MVIADLPYHPMVVHFPIALFLSAFGFEMMSFVFKKESLHRTAFHLYLLAALAAPLVVQTGLREDEELKIHHWILERHEHLALWTMGVSLVSLPILGIIYIFKKEMFRVFFVFCLAALVGLVSVTAYWGGRMVYEYGVGVEAQ
ncbi:MAG TPA: hypothetical protein DD723_06830 [Candidatus Omnitrophica bacterium]|uniref:DUF2231 domain-containing protein n=1 Tax=Candidatus Kaiserbacteria bacterium GW2011_GWA2_49_19 TaxID=1618669 RepID=A0A0G1VR32_9BACT|nr:MAG: hypothetical protein UY44_C0006G0006 [Candidatus Kaiserbacteria bacterium GW2011_GWA2_49_19]HBR15238.1 hypothetical protein [Candidatus Omnitrophota bacterium]